MSVQLRLLFEHDGKVPPRFEFIQRKGLDDDQLDCLRSEVESLLAQYYGPEAEEAVLYTLFEDLKDLVSTYNESVKGRCYICLE